LSTKTQFLCDLIKGESDITAGKHKTRAGELDCITSRSDQSRDCVARAEGRVTSAASLTAYADTLKEGFAQAFFWGTDHITPLDETGENAKPPQ